MSIRALLFDLDNTLLPEDDATLEAVRLTSERAARRARLNPRVVQLAAERAAESAFRAAPIFGYADGIGISWGEALWGDFRGEATGLRATRAWLPRFRHEVWAHAIAAAGTRDDALVDELSQSFPAIRRSIRPIDPDTEAILDGLATNYALGLVTNGAGDLQREKLATAGLASRFATIVISGDIGIGKPDSRPFELALEGLGVPARDAVMVGDSLERDIVGAQRAGLRGVWLDRTGRGAGALSAVPDAVITSLRELPAALGSLERAGAMPQPA